MNTHRGADVKQNISFGASDRDWQVDITIVNYVLAMTVSMETLRQSLHSPSSSSCRPETEEREGSQGLRTSGPRGGQAWVPERSRRRLRSNQGYPRWVFGEVIKASSG